LDVHHPRLFGHVVPSSTIKTFDALVAQVMKQEPYASANRVFWIVDNGGIDRGRSFITCLVRTVGEPRAELSSRSRQLEAGEGGSYSPNSIGISIRSFHPGPW
jgi:hypothetical protein